MRALVLQQPWDFYGVYAVYSQLLLLRVSISTVHLSAAELFLYPIWEFQWIKSTEFCKVNRKTDKTAGRFCFLPITMVTPLYLHFSQSFVALIPLQVKTQKEIQKSLQSSASILVLFLLFALLKTAIFLMEFAILVSKLSRLLHILNMTRNVLVRTKTHFQESKYYK